eukprot:scaffold115844_cov29-Tisochrysis_lutea.AAC.1
MWRCQQGGAPGAQGELLVGLGEAGAGPWPRLLVPRRPPRPSPSLPTHPGASICQATKEGGGGGVRASELATQDAGPRPRLRPRPRAYVQSDLALTQGGSSRIVWRGPPACQRAAQECG